MCFLLRITSIETVKREKKKTQERGEKQREKEKRVFRGSPMNSSDEMPGVGGEIAAPPGPPPPPPMNIYHHKLHRVVMHPTFFWGKNAEILFSGWPGTRTGMYVLSLVFVFVVSVLVEMLSHSQLIKSSTNSLLGGAAETIIHGVRVGLAYMVMLALMSFNAGIFIVAVAGHCLGFFLFGSRVFRNKSPAPQRNSAPDLPSMSC
ncbi:hypothetical protein AAG906_032654 [Vitis piasezkii]